MIDDGQLTVAVVTLNQIERVDQIRYYAKFITVKFILTFTCNVCFMEQYKDILNINI